MDPYQFELCQIYRRLPIVHIVFEKDVSCKLFATK